MLKVSVMCWNEALCPTVRKLWETWRIDALKIWADILQTKFSDAVPWGKCLIFWINFRWSFFQWRQLKICQLLFQLLTNQKKSLKQWWISWLMMTSSNGNIFRVTGPLWGESIGHHVIPLTKDCDAEFWRFLWSAPEQTVEQTPRRRWFETSLRSLWRHCNVTHIC